MINTPASSSCSIYSSEEIRLLVIRAAQAGRPVSERRLFASILRRMREHAIELEILYGDLPGVLSLSETARARFLRTLEIASSASNGRRSVSELESVEQFQHAKGPLCHSLSPVRFAVAPEVILQLTLGIEFATRGDHQAYARYVETLLDLWDRTRLIDHLIESAHQPIHPSGRDQLGEQLRLVGRDIEGLTPPDTGPQPVPGGAETFPLPIGDGDPWPGPDDGPSIPWPGSPPGGGFGPQAPPGGLPPAGPLPGGPVPGPDVSLNDLCRRLIKAGARGLRHPEIPNSTWAQGITGLSPNPACAGEPLRILGTGFGASQPPDVVVILGNQPLQVVSWSDTEIVVLVPQGARSGCIGFRNESIEAHRLNQFQQRHDALSQVAEGMACLGRIPAPLPAFPLVRSGAPCTPSNRFAGTLPEIETFLANGLTDLVVAPGTALMLSWDVRNTTAIRIRRTSPHGPAIDLTDPTGTSASLGAFIETRPVDAAYELVASNRCGTATATVAVRLRKVPKLKVEGVEFTQGIQTFLDPVAPDNSLGLVAHKNTVVRIYVSVDLGGFANDELPDVTATLTVAGATFLPINGIKPLSADNLATRAGAIDRITVRPLSQIVREQVDHTLNFLLPAAMCVGTVSPVIKVTAPAVETPSPGSFVMTPTVTAQPSCTFAKKKAMKLRYVRVFHVDGGASYTDLKARESVVRALDLLPTPATDIAPAWLPTWTTGVDLGSWDGRFELLDQLDDQHDCSPSEWLFPWEDECPDDDDAVWIGLTPLIPLKGAAQGLKVFGTSRNTVIADDTSDTIAHELGHTLKCNHVNPNVQCGIAPDKDGSFDSLPDDGRVQERDIFDVFFPGSSKIATHDIMSYACSRWISKYNWTRLFNLF
ncbi:IPT/TIG domain-containing protein [Arenibaculum pallidiluteum]|uniref:IPT/TIG domain-containing protein n=1 Tax=Arenibaculum pallidiluteum TaxID=2812559 RepID=UPI001A969334|nr:IPT/TIG domain-containing protein [Arenibaculum pallidiluteum]